MKIKLRNFAKIYRRLYGGGQVCDPPPPLPHPPPPNILFQTSVKFRAFEVSYIYIFVSFQQIVLSNLGCFINFKALFSVVSTDHVKSLKKGEGCIFQRSARIRSQSQSQLIY